VIHLGRRGRRDKAQAGSERQRRETSHKTILVIGGVVYLYESGKDWTGQHLSGAHGRARFAGMKIFSFRGRRMPTHVD